MAKSRYEKQAIEMLGDPEWRINNLYYIQDKQGRRVLFKLNWAQQQLYDEMWYCNVILKARQLGISTYICILFLDRCLFNPDQAAGIIAHTKEDAQHMFRRVKYAYDGLPQSLKDAITCDNDTADMLKFSNGSSLRVGVSLRSSTFQFLHISEFGKICAKYPEKAQEIITGSLNTVAAGQYVFIESTAEGREGYFYDICKLAQSRVGKDLSKLDYKFHFFPWWGDNAYRVGNCLAMNKEILDYFDHLLGLGIDLDDEQKNWYAGKESIQGGDMRREYPSTPDESWEQSNEGMYYGKLITQARIEKRISHVPYDDSIPVYTAWDLGLSDDMAIWFFQIYKKEIRLIDYEAGSGSLQHWLGIVKKRDYVYEKHLAPHDVMVRGMNDGVSRQDFARKMGINLIKVERCKDIIIGIDTVRNMLNRCWFDEKKCNDGISALENYKKEWDEKLGMWKQSPLHNWASHGADGFRTLAMGLPIIENKQTPQQLRQAEQNARQYQSNRFNQNGRSIF